MGQGPRQPAEQATPQGASDSVMPSMVNVAEARTHLSALLARVAAGERIVLARHGKPIAQLVPLDPSAPRLLSFLQGSVDAAFLEPLPEDGLRLWGV